MSLLPADFVEAFERPPAQSQQWSARFRPGYFDVSPCYALSPARSQSFHRRFLGGKPRGVTLKARRPALAVFDLIFGEHARPESFAAPRKNIFHPRYFHYVNSGR